MTSTVPAAPATIAALAIACALATGIPVSTADPGRASDREEDCRRLDERLEADADGVQIAKLRLRRRVCFNGRRITSAGALEATPGVTDAGRTRGWRFVRMRKESMYMRWDVRRRGALRSQLEARFARPSGTERFEADLLLAIDVYGDGTAFVVSDVTVETEPPGRRAPRSL